MHSPCRPVCSVILSKLHQPEPDSNPRDPHPPALHQDQHQDTRSTPRPTRPSGITNINGYVMGYVFEGVPSGVW
eukprot:gene16858-biopygen11340